MSFKAALIARQRGGDKHSLVGAVPSRENPRKSSNQIRSVAQSCPTLCDPMNRSTPGLPVYHQLPDKNGIRSGRTGLLKHPHVDVEMQFKALGVGSGLYQL